MCKSSLSVIDEIIDTCSEYRQPDYAAAQAVTKFAEETYSAITLQLCLKLGPLKKVDGGGAGWGEALPCSCFRCSAGLLPPACMLNSATASVHAPPPTCRRRPPAAPQVVKYLGLEGVCGGPTVSWWPVKEQVQVVQGISAIVARLDFAGLIQ